MMQIQHLRRTSLLRLCSYKNISKAAENPPAVRNGLGERVSSGGEIKILLFSFQKGSEKKTGGGCVMTVMATPSYLKRLFPEHLSSWGVISGVCVEQEKECQERGDISVLTVFQRCPYSVPWAACPYLSGSGVDRGQGRCVFVSLRRVGDVRQSAYVRFLVRGACRLSRLEPAEAPMDSAIHS